ncbi:MAG: hypothetical protein U0526_01785 [Candidatus Saccharibacteria bacterium]|jgi:hypothetical protein
MAALKQPFIPGSALTLREGDWIVVSRWTGVEEIIDIERIDTEPFNFQRRGVAVMTETGYRQVFSPTEQIYRQPGKGSRRNPPPAGDREPRVAAPSSGSDSRVIEASAVEVGAP